MTRYLFLGFLICLCWRMHKAMHSDQPYESAFWLLIGWNLIGLCIWIINEGGLPQ